jgi:K+-transporting ATPase KdpF subunit
MDLWFLGLIIVLAVLTWGGIVTLGLFGYLIYAMLKAEKF